jgi:hypothetical protein
VVAAVELYLDRVAERRIRALWNALEAAGVATLRDLLDGKHRPHLSLVAADRLDGPAIVAAMKGLSAVPPFPVTFQYVGYFPGGVVWLGLAPSEALLRHHTTVPTRLADAGIAGSPLYAAGTWVPHCTVSMRVPLAKLAEAVRLCVDILPVEATFTGAAVADHARGSYYPLPR